MHPFATVPHCDDFIDDQSQPECLRQFLHYHRLPAVCKLAGVAAPTGEKYIEPELLPHVWRAPEPMLFADHEGRRVRVVMASRFGDVGITNNLKAERGYDKRVSVAELSNFSEQH